MFITYIEYIFYSNIIYALIYIHISTLLLHYKLILSILNVYLYLMLIYKHIDIINLRYAINYIIYIIYAMYCIYYII